jgi:hypothetical protein
LFWRSKPSTSHRYVEPNTHPTGQVMFVIVALIVIAGLALTGGIRR